MGSVDLMKKETIAGVKELINGRTSPMEILDAARSVMEFVEKRIESRECFILDLFMAGEITKGISEIVKPFLKKGDISLKKNARS